MRELLLPSAIALAAIYFATNPADAADRPHQRSTATTRTSAASGSGARVAARPATGEGAARPASAPVILTGTVVAPGAGLQARSTPSQHGAVVRTLPHDAKVGITCYTRGTSVRGPFGESNVWDRLVDGRYVADVYVRTGRDTWRLPAC